MPNAQKLSLDRYHPEVDATVAHLRGDAFAEAFWAQDAALWPGGSPEEVGSMLGWIPIVSVMRERIAEIESFAADVQDSGFTRVVLCGMGGSSLAPYVLSKLFPGQPNGLPLHVLDSTHPAWVQEVENGGDLATTLFIVASKSGSTAEPSAFDAYFFDKVGKPENFVAITDPGSPFQASAETRGFRKIFLNFPDIGGRFSALSYFGLVPAALLRIDIAELLDRADAIVHGNRNFGPAFELGAALGTLAKDGLDKLTFLTTETLEPLGLWLEQLVAESTGKHGTGVLPIAGERAAAPSIYGRDRFFAVLRIAGDDLTDLDIHAEALIEAGHPTVVIELEDAYDVAAEFMRWEIATATAGAVLGINPFDQPNVQESKDVTKKILKSVEEQGDLPARRDGVEQDGLTIHGEAIADNVVEGLAILFHDVAPGSFVTIQAYLHETPAIEAALADLQALIRDELGVATTRGYGPRFLHSTGQYHKGGRNTGVFIQLTDQPTVDAPIPNQTATWRQFVLAQAMGDMEALLSKGRTIASVDLGTDPAATLPVLIEFVRQAIARREA
jgi:glucose-6-phosphate isomerase